MYVENCHYSSSVWISPPLLWSYWYLPQVLFWFASILDTSWCHVLYLLRSGCLCTIAQRPCRFRDISYFLLLFACVYVCVRAHACHLFESCISLCSLFTDCYPSLSGLHNRYLLCISFFLIFLFWYH